VAIGTMRAAGALTLLALGAFLFVNARGQRQSKKKAPIALGGAE
jgi:hypothetical protein